MSTAEEDPPATKTPPPLSAEPLKPALHHHEGESEGSLTKQKSDRHIVWDEDTIEKHDEDRGTRMKIDEPKTPYTEAKDDSSDAGSVGGGQSPSHCIASNWDEVSSKLHAVSKTQDGAQDQRGRSGSLSSEDGGTKKKHDEFVKHRHDHYNEYEMMKKFRQSHPDDEDGEDDGKGKTGVKGSTGEKK